MMLNPTARVVNYSAGFSGLNSNGTTKLTLGIDYLVTLGAPDGGDFLFVNPPAIWEKSLSPCPATTSTP